MENTNIRASGLKILIVICTFAFSMKGQSIIEYRFPKPVEDEIVKEYSRNFYNKRTQYLYVTLDFDRDTIIAYFGQLDKDIPEDKITPKYFVLNTNRYLMADSLKIPVVFKADFLFCKNSFVVKNHGSYIKFNSSGKIWKRG